ncbi:MAG: hypothetical protein PF436_06175 [Prolixibacteraceae bacterium]|nr:hypothetical protein [Prolixibacteraceae bacterium]
MLLYRKYKDGVIFTLAFHVTIFAILNISEFRVKKEFTESEIIIDFPPEFMMEDQKPQPDNNDFENLNQFTQQQTNVASNRTASQLNDFFDEDYQRELEQAQNLAKDVLQQLSKEIPTIDDLKMPEETTENIDPDSIMNKLYSGESNIEYFLEDRYHLRLPIPVYLSHQGGKIKVYIEVDNNGKVISAEPEGNSNRLLLSYAKTAALRTRFNAVSPSKNIQKGYIIYTFVAQ